MKIRILAAGSIALSVCCSLVLINQETEFAWLIGTWENKTKQGVIYETWDKISRSELAGKSYMVKGRDTTVFENIQLIKKNDTLAYIPKVQGQNNNQPVEFLMVGISGNELLFINKAHDYPQIISYKKVSKDSLVAEVSGFRNGAIKKQTFPMRRIR